MERSGSVVECRTRNLDRPGSNQLCYCFDTRITSKCITILLSCTRQDGYQYNVISTTKECHQSRQINITHSLHGNIDLHCI